jgi:hypothetical protein
MSAVKQGIFDRALKGDPGTRGELDTLVQLVERDSSELRWAIEHAFAYGFSSGEMNSLRASIEDFRKMVQT